MIVTDDTGKKQASNESAPTNGVVGATTSPSHLENEASEPAGPSTLSDPTLQAHLIPPYTDSPPVYTPSPGGGLVSDPEPQFGNHYIVRRDFGPFRGVFMIDPSITVPAAMLPDLSLGGVHPNLEARIHIGAIDVDLHVTTKQPFSGRATINLSTELGNVAARLHESSVPLSLSVRTEVGALSLAIPRGFRGMIFQSTEIGRHSFSSEVRQVATSRSDVRGRRRFFIGDLQGPGWEDNGATWTGNTIHLHTEIGGVAVRFIDEPYDTLKSGVSRFVSSIMG